MKKTFIIGATGFIGTYLFNKFVGSGWIVKGSYYKHMEEGLCYLDITDRITLLKILKEENPDVVFLPAANPNVEYCEQCPSETEKINVQGTLNVVMACKEIGAKLVYFSSDYVFDGTNGPYREEDIPNPISVYGKQKLASEKNIQNILKDYIIARVTVVYGWEKRGKNFVERLLKSLKNNMEIRVPKDQIGSPTYVENLTDMIFSLVENDAYGIYNVCGSDLMNRYDFACRAAKIFGMDFSLIKPVITSELQQKAPRPFKAGMITNKINNDSSVKPMGINEGLNKMKESNKNG